MGLFDVFGTIGGVVGATLACCRTACVGGLLAWGWWIAPKDCSGVGAHGVDDRRLASRVCEEDGDG